MRKAVVFFVVALAVAGVSAGAGVPPMINYQGKLMQPSGAAVPDGTYSMQFAIYDVPTGGTALWSETNPSVQVKGGLFAVLLGSVTNLPANIFDNPSRWFEVKVGSDPEMTPRQQVASSAFAFRAAVAGTVDDGAITTGKLADGAVTAAKIADGTITPVGCLGYSQITSAYSVSGVADNDVPGLSVTVSVPAGGRRIKITVWYPCLAIAGAGSGTATGFVKIKEGSTPLAHNEQSAVSGYGGTGSMAFSGVVMYSTVATAGSHTYRVSLMSDGNETVTLNADTGAPAFILVELI